MWRSWHRSQQVMTRFNLFSHANRLMADGRFLTAFCNKELSRSQKSETNCEPALSLGGNGNLVNDDSLDWVHRVPPRSGFQH